MERTIKCSFTDSADLTDSDSLFTKFYNKCLESG